MPEFCYIAMDSRGQETKGKLDVADQNEAIGRLKSMGYFPTRVEPSRPNPFRARAPKKSGPSPSHAGATEGLHRALNLRIPGFTPKANPKTLVPFTRQLARLVHAGLPLLRGLRLLERQEKNPHLRQVTHQLAIAIEGGSTFSEALAQHPKTFNHLFINMIKAGELGGVLEIVLARLAQFMEKAQKIKGKVKAALFYPIAVLVVAGAVVTILMLFIVPRFKLIFNDMLEGAPLPPFTNFVLGISQYIATHALQTFLGAVASVILLKLTLRTKPGRRAWDRLALNLPLIGPVIAKVAIARFTRTLGTLLGSGVPILQALQVVQQTAGNTVVSEAVADIHDNVKQGETITAPMEACGVFPPTIIGMIDVGEQTGALPEMLLQVADDYEEEVDNAVTALTSLLEPIMIVLLAIIVGSIVIALFLPLIQIIENFGDPTRDPNSPKNVASDQG